MIKMSTPEEKKKLEQEAAAKLGKEGNPKGDEQVLRVIHEFQGKPPEKSEKAGTTVPPAKPAENPTGNPEGKKTPENPKKPEPAKNPKEGEGDKGKDGKGDKVADELAATKLKLEQREGELQVIALKKLEGEVTEWASVIPDEAKRKVAIDSIMKSEDPLADFGRKKEMLGLFQQALEIGGIITKKPPENPTKNPKEGEGAGKEGDKAGKKPEGTKPEGTKPEGTGTPTKTDDNPDDVETPPPAGDGTPAPPPEQLVVGRELIDIIYDKLGNPKTPEDEKVKARARADELIDQFIKGRQKAIKENPKHEYYVGYFMCPKCGKSIPAKRGEKRATNCPHCKAILTRRAT